jgi:hypothetical protein
MEVVKRCEIATRSKTTETHRDTTHTGEGVMNVRNKRSEAHPFFSVRRCCGAWVWTCVDVWFKGKNPKAWRKRPKRGEREGAKGKMLLGMLLRALEGGGRFRKVRLA